ncbi:MAG TPA: NADH-quinone oxidoreductase subunit K [Chloroflexaceae bacterium]|nr:NADH-quinone oxidoreductase subunit K [Chloroflexaceae bacterium]
MNFILSLVVGTLFATAIYLMLRRSVVKLILGLVLLSHGAHLLLFLMGDGLVRGNPAFVDPATNVAPPDSADPLIQALILTAIVISFGLTAFVLALAYRADQAVKSDDLDMMTSTDKL